MHDVYARFILVATVVGLIVLALLFAALQAKVL